MAQVLYRDLAKPIADVRALLRTLKRRGIKCAIASSSKRSWIDLALQTHRLNVYFDVIVSAHDPGIQLGKPNPDVYVAAIRSLGCVVENLIAIEDSANGVAAAKSAQLFCLGFLSDKTQDLGMADATIQTFKELRLCLQQ